MSSGKVPETHQGMAMNPSHAANMKALLSELDNVIQSGDKDASGEAEDASAMSEIKASTTTATKELDALMASLSDFKVSQGKLHVRLVNL